MSVWSAMDPIGPTNPFHLQKAYDVAGPTARPITRAQSGGTLSIRPVSQTHIERLTGTNLNSPDVFEPSRSKDAARIVAAKVPGDVDFTVEDAPQAGVLPLYRHPADRNEAATRIDVGRSIDITA